MTKDKDTFLWEKALSEPVNLRTLPTAVKNASLIGHNIYKCLRGDIKLGFNQVYDIPFGNTLSFRKSDACKAFKLTAGDTIVGIITLNVFHGISKKDMSRNFDTDRFKTTTNAIVCLSADDNCAYYACLVMFSSAFIPGELSDYIRDWKLPIEDNITSQLLRLSAKALEKAYHLETASEYNFEERD